LELTELQSHINQIMNRNRLIPQQGPQGPLRSFGGLGNLLADAIGTTEDFAQRNDLTVLQALAEDERNLRVGILYEYNICIPSWRQTYYVPRLRDLFHFNDDKKSEMV
jgi:hypothetical protein